MASGNRVGEYLRARRELVAPEDVGLVDQGRRRVPGLRREEVAMLAGISADYYVRLEQGRDHHPSELVIEAIGRALLLDGDAVAHLRALAEPAPPRRRKPAPRPERVPAGVLGLLDSLVETPAYVYGRYLDVLAANRLAGAMVPYYRVGENLVRAAFLDPKLDETHGDRELATESAVAALRALTGPDVDDPRLEDLVGELSVRSERFRELWARHDVKPKRSGRTAIENPQVGTLDLGYEKLPIPDTDRMTLVLYHAEPGSRSAQGLALLASSAAVAAERPSAVPD
jgi:transcriptional regulator with XRE-family HTH domain